MLSLYKLYKHDMQHQRRRVTDGPKGRPTGQFYRSGTKPAIRIGPKKGVARAIIKKDVGSPCYRCKHVDWAMHRALPTIMDREMQHTKHHKYGPFAHTVQKIAPHVGYTAKQATRTNLLDTSPRWGLGMAKGLHYDRGGQVHNWRERVKVPSKASGDIEISHKTYAVAGAAVAAGVGYEAYKHRKQIAQKAHVIDQKFHHSRFYHTMHSSHAPGVA